MRLFEHPDFEQAIIRAAEHFRPRGLRESIIEKDDYYDLFRLVRRPEVLAMLRSEEYAAIKADYDRISTEHFPRFYVPPPDTTFARSDALFPPTELRAIIAAGFEAQCRMLCFGPFPTWDEVQASLEDIRGLL